MTAAQKLACFNLSVVVLTVVTVLILIPVLGPGAQGGFGFLGLLGFGPLFFRRRRNEVVEDERDRAIQRRSVLIAYTVFWLAFVAAWSRCQRSTGGRARCRWRWCSRPSGAG